MNKMKAAARYKCCPDPHIAYQPRHRTWQQPARFRQSASCVRIARLLVTTSGLRISQTVGRSVSLPAIKGAVVPVHGTWATARKTSRRTSRTARGSIRARGRRTARRGRRAQRLFSHANLRPAGLRWISSGICGPHGLWPPALQPDKPRLAAAPSVLKSGPRLA